MSQTKSNQCRQRVRPPLQGGFTLIELLVTIIVLGIVITSLSNLYYITQDTQTQSQTYDLAVRADRTEIEELRNDGFDSLSPGTNINFASSLPANFPAGASAIAAISQPVSGLIRVDATITYTEFGKSQTVILSSNIGIIGIGQG